MAMAAFAIALVVSSCDSGGVEDATTTIATPTNPRATPVPSDSGDRPTQPDALALCLERSEILSDDQTTDQVTVDDLNRLFRQGAARRDIRIASSALLGVDFGGVWMQRVDGTARLVIAVAGDASALAGLRGAETLAVEHSEAQLRCVAEVFHSRVEEALGGNANDQSDSGLSAVAGSWIDWRANRAVLETTPEIADRLDLSDLPSSAYLLQPWTPEAAAPVESMEVVLYWCETRWPGHRAAHLLTIDEDEVTNSLIPDDVEVVNTVGLEQRGVLTTSGSEQLRELLADLNIARIPGHFEGVVPPDPPGWTVWDEMFETTCELQLALGDTIETYTWAEWPADELVELGNFLTTQVVPITGCASTESIIVVEPCTYLGID